VDALGNPTGFGLTPEQADDLEGVDVLSPDTPASTVIADTAYDVEQRIITALHKAGKHVVIPPKRCQAQPRDYDWHLYRLRHLLEQVFNKVMHYRSIVTRYDKTARNFRDAIYLAATVVWLN